MEDTTIQLPEVNTATLAQWYNKAQETAVLRQGIPLPQAPLAGPVQQKSRTMQEAVQAVDAGPEPPTNLLFTGITDTTVSVSWTKPRGPVTGFKVTYTHTREGPEVTISVSCNAAAQQLEQLEPSTGHQGDRNSVWATTAFTTTGGRGGDGPKDLTASQVTPRSPVLTWKPPSSKVSGYKLQYAIEGQAFQAQTDLRKHKLLRLRPGSKYLVRLQSDMGGVYTEAITIEFTTGDLRFPFPSDCSQELLNGVQESGLVEIFPLGQASVPVSVYCDMETDRGGWTVRAVAKEQLGAASASVCSDSMTYHNGRHFSTRDRDRSDIRFCAMFYRGGWWYRNCHEANLNGLYNTAHNQERLIRHKTQENKQRFFGLLARLTVAETDHRITVLMNMLTMEAKHHKTRRTYGDARVPVKMGVYGVVMAWLNMQHGIPGQRKRQPLCATYEKVDSHPWDTVRVQEFVEGSENGDQRPCTGGPRGPPPAGGEDTQPDQEAIQQQQEEERRQQEGEDTQQEKDGKKRKARRSLFTVSLSSYFIYTDIPTSKN
ncbi:hypothetical protein ACEWY4_015141 [Coilia grayii]|uniref:Uncharacterized protein n=1 Tax=Coilia grayii TaxID=363190 RepID=A0ABD1JUM3_9TELE